MADIKKNVTLRLTLENGNVVGAQLEGLGKTGEGAGQKIEKGFAGASTALRAFAPIVGGLSVAGLAMMTKSALDTVGALGEQAEQLSVSTRALQVYQFAGTQAGVSSEQLSTSLGIFAAKVGDAREGNTQAIKSFERLGVGVLDVNGKFRATEDVVSDVAEAISREADANVRAALAKDLFGKSGQKLLPILSQGRAGLQAFDDELVRSGRLLDEETIKKADEAADKIAAMEHNFGRLAQNIVAFFAPAIASAADGIDRAIFGTTTLTQKVTELRDELAQTQAGGGFGRSAAQVAKDLQAAEDQLAAMDSDRARRQSGAGRAASGPTRNPRSEDDIKRAEQHAQAIDKVVRALDAEIAAMQASEKERFVLQKLQAAGADLSEKEAAAIRDKAAALWEAQRAEKEAAERGKAIDKQLADEDRANAQAKKQSIDALQDGERKLFAEGIRLRESLRTPNEAYQAQLDKVNELYDKGAISSETYLRAQLQALQDLSAAEDGAKEKAGGLTEVFEAMGQRTARALGDMAVGLNKNEDALQTFLNLLQTAGSDFISGVIAQQGTMPAFKQAGGWLDGLFADGGFLSGIFHEGGIVGSGSRARRVSPAMFAHAPRFHTGGILGADEMPIIAKRGEEVLTERDPRHARNGGAATSIRLGDINIDARGAAAGVEARLQVWASDLRRQTMQDVENAMRSGGSLSRAARLRGG